MTDSPLVRSGPIRYATARRFARPQLVAADDRRPSSGQICPQLPSRLDAVMGSPRDTRPQGEDCLNLSITTPGRDERARPVLVWFHGGGFNSGAGLMDWYDGGRLTTEGDVVVVSVNYRLGALGYLYLDGVSDGNLGLYDQLEALRWVRAHIAGYGGDPDNVTIFGQSAGGVSVRLLLGLADARGLFRRAIMQSAPLPMATRSRDSAIALGRIFAEELGEDPSTADVGDLLRAVWEVAMLNRRLSRSTVEPPFNPVDDVSPLRDPGQTFEENVRGLDVMYGWNADDMSAFPNEAGETAELTERAYARPLREFGARLERAGARVHEYRLDWRPAGSRYGATHCLELPLLLGPWSAWTGSPMLGGVARTEVDSFGRALRNAWVSFARTGEPDVHCTAGWPLTWSHSPTAQR